MSQDLIFSQPPIIGGAIVFGDDGAVPSLDRSVKLDGALPALTLSARLAPPADVTIAAALPSLTLSASVGLVAGVTIAAALPSLTMQASAQRDNAVKRYIGAIVVAPHNRADAPRPDDVAPWGTSINRRGGHDARWQPATRSGRGIDVGAAQPATPAQADRDAGWQTATHAGHDADACGQAGDAISETNSIHWQTATSTGADAAACAQAAINLRVNQSHNWQPAKRIGGTREGRSGHGGRWRGPNAAIAPWQRSRKPATGRWTVTPPIDPPPCYTPSGSLVFSVRAPASLDLVFSCTNDGEDGGTIIVPIKRAYIVINNIALHLAGSGTPVPCLSMRLSIDTSSWAWGFDASLPAKSEPLLMPVGGQPVELIATINDTEFRVWAESISRERSFGDATIRVSGRGHNAVLAAPYAPISHISNDNPRTAQQLMADVLTVNGVSLGWTIDWGIQDWLVPESGFIHQGSYMDGLNAIAQAAGAYILPHPNQNLMRVRHLYPAAPWDWGSITPDVTLPVDTVQRESVRWLEKPAYNRVFVAGQDVGIVGQVTRGGTAGDFLAPMIVDRLITHADAARQRGRAVLSDTGRQIDSTWRVPLGVTGLIEPGTFVQYQDGSGSCMGLVRSTQIEAGFPDVWQVLGVKSHA